MLLTACHASSYDVSILSQLMSSVLTLHALNAPFPVAGIDGDIGIATVRYIAAGLCMVR